MHEELVYDLADTPIGPLLLLASTRGVRHIEFPRDGRAVMPEVGLQRDVQRLAEAVAQLRDYFAGLRLDLDFACDAQGTPFQHEVWNALRTIPVGETLSYGELASRIGRPNASRAVGAANGANPLPIIVPCHRVIGSNGSLTGFGGGLPTKRWLLDHERRHAPRPPLELRP
ncbi:MAG: methylated-DNA--[protein]-cysteine S-methyltransferase [Rhodanobacteraceae bacterium]|nr:methylated-DNA--[protein]-cysteine S-methyltransferase [Rhodanobacteraceae bacterium]